MIYYVINDDLEVLHRIELGESEMIAAPQNLSVIDADTVQDMIDAGSNIVIPEYEEDV